MLFADPMELFSSLGSLSIVILLTLAIFSVVSWAIIVQKWRRFRVIDEEDTQFLRAYELGPQQINELRLQAQELDASPSAAVYLGIIDRLPSFSDLLDTSHQLEQAQPERFPERDYLEKVSQHIIQNQISHQESYLPFLATTGNLTPFIGLLGTVLGIISAFREIGVQGSASIASVAPGVAEALIATAAGLFAAIPAVIAYNYFLAKIRKTVFRVEAFGIEFLNSVQELNHASKETAEVGR
ncbi:MAG: MotA/TolQ/ExbB proton channel family protein [Nitrospirales bacterium]|nr:MotA/TolQ/ExbB proton channel family protein [Nitrospirales bacterium]